MVKRQDVVNEACYLANRGIGVNPDFLYGSQCVDLINHIMIKFFKIRLWGNAIDLLDSASEHGLFIKYNANDDINPKAGDVFVMDTRELYGHPFGHTGVVIEDSDGYTIKTVEQNIDGNADALEVGGPARYNTRSFAGIVGWFRPNYEEDDASDATETGSDTESVIDDWKQVNGAWYRYDADGDVMTSQWFKEDDKWYYLKDDGAMAHGWHKIDNKWYFFDADGSMHEGWLSYYDKWYYLNPSDGDMVSRECRNINGDWYYFNEDGDMLEKANITVDSEGKIHF
jgi:hypothetical protein